MFVWRPTETFSLFKTKKWMKLILKNNTFCEEKKEWKPCISKVFGKTFYILFFPETIWAYRSDWKNFLWHASILDFFVHKNDENKIPHLMFTKKSKSFLFLCEKKRKQTDNRTELFPDKKKWNKRFCCKQIVTWPKFVFLKYDKTKTKPEVFYLMFLGA